MDLFVQFFADPDDSVEDRPWIVDLLVALDAQLERVRRNLSSILQRTRTFWVKHLRSMLEASRCRN